MANVVTLLSHRRITLVVAAVALMVFGASLFAEHVLHLRPCMLCLYQRYGWLALGVVAGLLFFLSHGRLALFLLAGFCLCLMSLSAYQVAVEKAWLPAPAACRSSKIQASTPDDLWEQMEDNPMPPCDLKPQTLFGFSMAVYGAIMGLILSLYCLTGIYFENVQRRR